MLRALIALLTATAPLPSYQHPVEVNVLELNHQFSWHQDNEGQYQRATEFEQWIVWHAYEPQDEEDAGIHVWCWIKHERNIVAQRRRGGGWQLAYDGVPVHAKVFHETWTESDPEVADSRLLPKSKRRTPIKGWRR